MSIATINVNLKKCDCWKWHEPLLPTHQPGCSATPILIPCPFPPSVTFNVVLGECMEADKALILPNAKMKCGITTHATSCPARPVKVAYSIFGKTWETTTPGDVEVFPNGRETVPADLLRVTHERFALVNALMMGRDPAEPEVPVTAAAGVLALFHQRDAFFSALAEVARMEQALYAAQQEAHAAGGNLKWEGPRVDGNPELRGSAAMLQAWVKKLIEQAGVMT